ncbi:TetR/AcrR family transcriptional regulator [Nocardia cyriacigeorgica]|uniref:TetR/AcrR family transcriptional regulator n=1 Tax=Nocardia cyriacigeorgica TaxID=135487 RepID=A0A5R8NFX0_9NOCA|nr:TetR/AcrR family transcriptional regulator [Nocardia cyriacigeorgica]
MVRRAGQGVRDVPGRRVDARTERWREHRVKVRAEFVDAAFEALGAFGPEVSMGEIAKAAGAAKPKLYRHFADKADLYDAIVDRMRDLLWERIVDGVDLTNDPVRELIRRGANEYVAVVTQHPNVFRFILNGHFAQRRDSSAESPRSLQSARQAARQVADLFVGSVAERPVDPKGVELVIYSVFGAVASATDWWLGANLREDPMPVERFVAYLTEMVSALACADARLSGFTIDADQPLHLAFTAD